MLWTIVDCWFVISIGVPQGSVLVPLLISVLIYVYIQGVSQTLSSKATHNEYICQKKEKKIYIAVNSVRMC